MVLDIIVVTAPNERICCVYKELLEDAKFSFSWLKHCEIRCFADPSGIRIGSGGGTLRALAGVLNEFSLAYLETRNIAIVHSGGDSQRSPFHSICGKAWSTINSIHFENTYATAFTLLLTQLQALSLFMLPGSLLISCSDVLLDLNLANLRSTLPSNCICAVAIPEAVATARNHGVFQIAEISMSTPFLAFVKNYFQKPSNTQMSACLLAGGSQALIDSGLVIAHGTALKV